MKEEQRKEIKEIAFSIKRNKIQLILLLNERFSDRVFLRVCAYCGKVCDATDKKYENMLFNMDEIFGNNKAPTGVFRKLINFDISHGICPQCSKIEDIEIDKIKKR